MSKITRFLTIKCPGDTFPFNLYQYETPQQAFGPLSLINIFIGANNSGKSMFLRGLVQLLEFDFQTNNYDGTIFRSFIEKINPLFKSIFEPGLSKVGNIEKYHFDDLNPLSDYISSTNPIHKIVDQKLNELKDSSGSGITYDSGATAARTEQELKILLREYGKKAINQYKKLNIDTDIGGYKRYYIPILRGMRPLTSKSQNEYRNRTNKDYFIKMNEPHTEFEVFTGIELFNILKNKLLGEPQDREDVKSYEEYLSKYFFQSMPITLIPKEGADTVHIKIGDEDQFPIFNLGDGLQSLIISTFNIFMEKERSLFFIEEPDMCMHPSMQRAFLEVLTKHRQHQYFITTHSNHFLDMTLDFSNISLFHFRKIKSSEDHLFQIRIASTGDQNILSDLGVKNSSVFLSNSTIWVEGITDRLYLRAYMSKYIEELKDKEKEKHKILSGLNEDYHYSFVEYQGANITHWSFDPKDQNLERIKANYLCASALLIADGDIRSKSELVKIFKSMLGDRFIILPCKEIENLIPIEILKEIVTKKFEANKVSTDQLIYKDYSGSKDGLGKYLDDLLGLEGDNKLFSSETGTIVSNKKVGFCKVAVKAMNDPAIEWTLTPKLKELCESIFNHVEEQNQ